MPEAVIVSALRTPIGTARKGTLRDTTAFDLAHHVVSEAAADLDPTQVDDVILGEGLYGGGVIARHAAITAGLAHVPGLANNRHCAAGQAAVQTAAASVRAGMDQLIIAGGVNSASTSPRSKAPGGRGVGRLVPADPSGPSRRAQHGHVDHRRLERRGQGRRQPRGDGRLGAALAPQRDRRDRRGPLQRGDRSRSRRRTASSRSTSTRAATPAMEKLAALKPLHPEIEGFSITAGNACGANDGAAVLTIASDAAGPARAGHGPVLGVGRGRPRGDRPGPGRGDPEGACPRGPYDLRRGPVRDQRGVRVDVRGHRQDARSGPGQGERQRQRLLAGPPDRGDRSPDAGHAGARAAPPRRRHRRRRDVRRRRHGLRDGHRGARQP